MTEMINEEVYSEAEISSNRLRWIERLELNDLPQGKGALRSDQGYCCLGVAEEVLGKLTRRGSGWWVNEDGSSSVLSIATAKKLGIAGIRGFDDPQLSILIPPEFTSELGSELGLTEVCAYTLNDSKGWSFPQIAEVLRKMWNLPKGSEVR